MTHKPVKGVKRPAIDSHEGKTPALGDHQARQMLDTPEGVSVKGKRDQVSLAILLYHALRRTELYKLKVKNCWHEQRGIAHLKIVDKGGKTPCMPLHPAAGGLIVDYLEAAGHGDDDASALFRPLHHNRGEGTTAAMKPDGVYRIVRAYSKALGFGIGAHALQATAATNPLDRQANIAKVQQWLGHATIATTRITTTARPSRKTARRSRSRIDQNGCRSGRVGVFKVNRACRYGQIFWPASMSSNIEFELGAFI